MALIKCSDCGTEISECADENSFEYCTDCDGGGRVLAGFDTCKACDGKGVKIR